MSDNNELIYLGVVSGAHGIKGHITVRSFTASPKTITSLPLKDKNGNSISLKFLREAKKDIVCFMEGIDNRNKAEEIRGLKLYTERSNLPEPDETEHYINDLEKLDVIDQNNNIIGRIIGIYNFGAGDVVEISFLDKKSEMYPFTKECFPIIAKTHIVFIKPLAN